MDRPVSGPSGASPCPSTPIREPREPSLKEAREEGGRERAARSALQPSLQQDLSRYSCSARRGPAWLGLDAAQRSTDRVRDSHLFPLPDHHRDGVPRAARRHSHLHNETKQNKTKQKSTGGANDPPLLLTSKQNARSSHVSHKRPLLTSSSGRFENEGQAGTRAGDGGTRRDARSTTEEEGRARGRMERGRTRRAGCEESQGRVKTSTCWISSKRLLSTLAVSLLGPGLARRQSPTTPWSTTLTAGRRSRGSSFVRRRYFADLAGAAAISRYGTPPERDCVRLDGSGVPFDVRRATRGS